MNFIDSLFDWTLQATIRGSVLALIVMVLQLIFRTTMPARWRYALWLPVVLSLAVPSLLRCRWSMENQFSGFFSYPTSLPFQMEMSRNIAVLHVTEQGRLLLYSWHEVAALIWLTGVMGLLAFSLITYRRTLRRIRHAQVPASSELRDAILEAATCSGLRRTPLLLVSAKVQSPAVTGLFRPVLLLPARFPGEQLTPAETKLVLLHEMTHLKRFDLPVNWFLFFLQTLHCFNPLLWFAFARMRIDRECACDAQVLATSKEDRRAEYGHALLKLESVPGPSEFSLGFIGIRERYQNVRSRIQAIAGYHRPHPAWSILTAGLIVTLLVAGATRAENPAPAGKPESPKKGTPSGPVEISGDTTAYSAKDHTAIASGHARYGQRGMTVTVQADTIRYNPDKHTLEAIGNVTVARVVDLIVGGHVFLDCDTGHIKVSGPHKIILK